MTEIASPGLGRAEDTFKNLAFDPLVDAELAALFSAVPALSVWPVGPLIRYFAHLWTDRIYGSLRTVVDVQAIAFTDRKHQEAFDRAEVALLIIGREKGVDSEEFRKAKDNAREALARFVRVGASR